jgi:hypothetical protein
VIHREALLDEGLDSPDTAAAIDVVAGNCHCCEQDPELVTAGPVNIAGPFVISQSLPCWVP